MLPDMSEVLLEWEIPVLLKTVVERTVDQVPDNQVSVTNLLAVVQPASKSRVNPEILDWSRRYLQVHSRTRIYTGQVIEFQGADYKIVDDGDYQLYGFSEVIAESTGRPILQANP